MFEKLISTLFASRTQAHVFHLQSKSYSEHIALQAYYDGILDLTILPAMGCEMIADQLYKYVNGVYIPDMWGPGEAERLWCYRVEVRETQSNMAFREGHREWNEDLFA